MTNHSVSFLTRMLLGVVLVWVHPVSAAAVTKTTLLAPLDDEPSWRDMAFLAAVPASEVANGSGGSLVALEPTGLIGPEIRDYLRRYGPGRVHLLGNPPQSTVSNGLPEVPPAGLNTLPVTSAEDAALRLSRIFWESGETVVICKEDDYESALIAAPLAALLKAPLLYATTSGISEATEAEMKRLDASLVLSVGQGVPVAGAVNLAGARDVMMWAKGRGIDVDYIAVVNPLDRAESKVRKLSMVGSQLAAGRKGLVIPLPFEVEWKKPSRSMPPEMELPAEFQNQDPPARAGTLVAGAAAVPYILSGNPGGKAATLFIDRDGSGGFTGPIHSGDTIELDGRQWMVSLGIGSSYHDADVHITWPHVDELTSRLRQYYEVIGKPPTYLCLVGLPDTIPHGIVRGRVLSPDIATDLPFAVLDDPQSSRIAVGRVVAEDIGFGSLYAARVLTYLELLDDEWANRACQAEWENGFTPLFANAGFDASYRLTDEDIPWVEKPTEGKKGERAPSFKQDSPLARAKLLAHSNHSWNFELGRTMKWDATVLMAPTVVESGGCGTTSLDRSAPGQAIVEGATGAQSPELAVRHRSVVSRLFRLGAVSFAGGSREMTAQQLPLRHEFWNGVLAGQSVGTAHRRSQNTGLLILKETGDAQGSSGYWHNLQARTLLGDPALSIRLPGQARSAPAKTWLSGDRLTVHAPESWEIMKLYVPPDWKKWVGRDIFVARGAGAYSLSSWGPEERDVEVPMVLAEFRSDKRIKAMTQLDTPEAPLGWSGVWHTCRNRDGTYTHRFSVRMLDLDQENGKVLASVDRLEFSVKFEP